MRPVHLYLAKAESEFKAKRFESAMATLTEGLRAHPANADLHAHMGILLCFGQMEPKAVEHLERAKGAKTFAKLGQILTDHFECRRLMAAKLNIKDDAGDLLRKRVLKISGLKPGPVGISISACLIVKNEEKQLDRCLRSLQGLVDEIVVVDTGSTDRTVEIAESYGAKLGYFEWINDFSAARNESLRLATGHWALWIDADEEVDPSSISMLREGLMRPHFGGYFIQIDNCLGDGTTNDHYVHTPVRLFQRLDGVEFTLRIHEQVLPSLDRLGLVTATIEGAKLNHYGYTAAVMTEKNKLDRTISMLNREIEDAPQEPFHWFNLANALVVSGRWEEAAKAAEQAVGLMADDAAYGSLTYHLLCSALCDIGRPDKALERCQEAESRGMGSILIQYERVHALGKLNRFDEALEAADKCLTMEWPTGLNGDYGIFTHKRHLLKAQILAQLGRFDESLELFDHALSVDPGLVVAVYGKGSVLLTLGRYHEALPELQKCFANPEYGLRAMRGASDCLFRLHRFAEASELLETQWNQGVRDEDLFSLWAQACERTADASALLGAFQAYGAEQEPSATILINWGRALQAAGDATKALNCYSEAIKRDPDDPNGYLNLGDLLYLMEQYGDAAHLYETALRLKPDLHQAWFVLGNCLYQLGLQSGARIAWNQTLSQHPSHLGAKNNLALLNEQVANAA